MRQLGTSTINFRGEILQKNSSLLYIQTGVYITMGPYNIDNKPRYLPLFHLFYFFELKFQIFGGNGQAFISRKQKDLSAKSIPFVLK